MKKLTKIKLINWMYFSDNTIEIAGNTLITGVNASGKSTIIDALQYLFMGGLRGLKFNSAANEQGKRTLEGYVRGKTSTDKQDYLRKQNCLGHIAIEITDDSDISSIIGVVIETTSGDSAPNSVFYKIDNAKIVDDFFINREEYPHSYSELARFVKSKGKTVKRFGSVTEYRDMLKSYLGIDAHKYAKLLPNAIGVGSVTKMDDFINNFLLEEDNVEVKDLQENIQSMKRLIEKIELDEKKLKGLEDIIAKGNVITQRREKIKIIDIARVIAELRNCENEIEKCQKEIDLWRKDRKIKQEILGQRNKDLDAQKEAVREIERELDRGDEHRALLALDKKIKELESKLEKEVALFEETRQTLQKIRSSVTALALDGYDEFVPADLDVGLGTQALLATVQKYYDRFNFHIEKLNERLYKIKDELQKNIAKLKENNEKLDKLKQNIKDYPSYVSTLLHHLRQRLSEKHRKVVEVKPLCEYVESIDEAWRNALEGYLNTQRFDIIAEPHFFDECLEIYEEIKSKYNIYGIGIVNTAKFSEEIVQESGSLSDKINFHNRYARNYAYSILNKVVCVDKLHELKNHSNAITKTCMRYSGHAARQINFAVYSAPYLGLDANKLRIKALEQENIAIDNFIEKINEEKFLTDKQIRIFKESGIDKLVHNDVYLLSIDRKKELAKEKEKEDKAKKELEKNPTLMFLRDKLNSEDKRQKKIEIEVIDISAKIKNLSSLIQKNDLLIDKLIDDKGSAERKYQEIEAKNRILMSDAEKRYRESASGNANLEAIKKSLDNARNSYATYNLETELASIMTGYCMSFSFGAAKNFEALPLYQAERNQIADSNLKELLTKNTLGERRPPTRHGGQLLTGLLYCGQCGSKLTSFYSYQTNEREKPKELRKRIHYYRCVTDQKPKSDILKCKPSMWSTKYMDESVIKYAKRFVKEVDKNRLLENHEDTVKTKLDEAAKHFDKIESDVVKNEREIRKLKDEIMKALLGESTFSQAVLSDMLKAKEREGTDLLKKQEAAQNRIFELDQEMTFQRTIKDEFNDWESRFDAASAADKKAMLLNIIDRITINGDNISVDFKVELNPLSDLTLNEENSGQNNEKSSRSTEETLPNPSVAVKWSQQPPTARSRRAATKIRYGTLPNT